MNYHVIFTDGFEDSLDYLSKQLRCDVLLLGDDGNYYNPQFITIDRIKGEFSADVDCYVEDNLVILHEITKENIIKVIPQLYKWQFDKRWQPVQTAQLEKYFNPIDKWEKVLIQL